MYDKILVAVDYSEISDRAVVAARDLAVLSRGEVWVLHLRERETGAKTGALVIDETTDDANAAVTAAVDAASHDPARHILAAAHMTRDLSHDSGDHVVVLHVHEFATGRFGRIRVDCGEGEGEGVVEKIVAELQAAGIGAEGEVREARLGHVAAAILHAAADHDARLVVLGSSSRTDLPRIPLGSVATRLLHMATRPVLIVPRSDAHAEPA